jgi:hypothetical protein
MYVAKFNHSTNDRNFTAFEEAVNTLRKKLPMLQNRDYVITLKQKDHKPKAGGRCDWTRTMVQNRLYHLWLSAISIETGNDTNSLHEYFKRTFLPYTEVTAFGKTIGILSSTADLTTKDFDKYLKEIEAFASTELGMTLPHINDTIEYYMEELPIDTNNKNLKKKR